MLKFRVLSNYDIAKNLVHIINQAAEQGKNRSSKIAANVLNLGSDAVDTFVKQSEKAAK